METEIKTYKANNGFIPEEKLIRYLDEITNGLQYLDSKEIVHGCLNPETILITDEGFIKIAAYGLFSLFDNIEDADKCMSWNYSYMSPEILSGEKADISSDIWSLGCIFHYLCTSEVNYYNYIDFL